MKRNTKLYHKIWNKLHPDDLILSGDGNVIHHIDGNSENNNIDNLIKLKHKDHTRLHHKNKKLSNETKTKISKAFRGIKHLMYGKHHSRETKQKMSKIKIGENNYKTNLTWSTVNWIRDILDSEEYKEAKKKRLISQTKLAELFGTKQCVISKIKNNKSWKIGEINENIK